MFVKFASISEKFHKLRYETSFQIFDAFFPFYRSKTECINETVKSLNKAAKMKEKINRRTSF